MTRWNRWAEMAMDARQMMREAEELAEQANRTRCMEEDSGGARCTADALPSHQHRYDTREMPHAYE